MDKLLGGQRLTFKMESNKDFAAGLLVESQGDLDAAETLFGAGNYARCILQRK